MTKPENIDSTTDDDTEIFKDSDYNSWLSRLFILMIITFVGVCVFFAIEYIYNTYYKSKLEAPDIKVITAPSHPIKIQPADPGGMVVENMDKYVYDNITSNKHLPTVEQILPEPEQPISRKKLKLKQKNSLDSMMKEVKNIPVSVDHSEAPTEEMVDIIQQNLTDDTTQVIHQEDDLIATKNLTLDDIVKFVENKSTQQKIMYQVGIPKKRPQLKQYTPQSKEIVEKQFGRQRNPEITSGDVIIQLASYRSYERAEQAWKELKNKHAAELSKLQHHIEKRDLKEKGVFYRLQAGKFKSDAEARVICKKLKTKHQDCLVSKVQ